MLHDNMKYTRIHPYCGICYDVGASTIVDGISSKQKTGIVKQFFLSLSFCVMQTVVGLAEGLLPLVSFS